MVKNFANMIFRVEVVRRIVIGAEGEAPRLSQSLLPAARIAKTFLLSLAVSQNKLDRSSLAAILSLPNVWG